MISLEGHGRYVINSDIKVIGAQLVDTYKHETAAFIKVTRPVDYDEAVAFMKVDNMAFGYIMGPKRVMYHEPLLLYKGDVLEIEYLTSIRIGTANILTEEII